MFDKLVESAKSKNGAQSGRYFCVTGVVYLVALTTLGVATIFNFSPALAEGIDLTALTPPVPLSNEQPIIRERIPRNAAVVSDAFVPPKRVQPVLPPDELARRPVIAVTNQGGADGAFIGFGKPNGVPGAGNANDLELPEPPDLHKEVKIKPTPSPIVASPKDPVKKSEGVIQGLAIRRVTPAYPSMGRAVRASGPVQVQITISEEGRVLEAYVVSGHPLLRATALEAARQWVFKPTLLSGIPVKVQGVLTFNFTLN